MRPPFASLRRHALPSVLSRPLVLLLLLCSMACATLRGRADDALERGDYGRAVELYTQVLARDPSDARVKALLTRAERGLFDQMLDRADAARAGGNEGEVLRAALEAVQTKDRLHADSVDPPRAARITVTITGPRPRSARPSAPRRRAGVPSPRAHVVPRRPTG